MSTGTILAYNNIIEAGVIKGIDGKGYYFTKADWSSVRVKPANDMNISFIKDRGRALNVTRVA